MNMTILLYFFICSLHNIDLKFVSFIFILFFVLFLNLSYTSFNVYDIYMYACGGIYNIINFFSGLFFFVTKILIKNKKFCKIHALVFKRINIFNQLWFLNEFRNYDLIFL